MYRNLLDKIKKNSVGPDSDWDDIYRYHDAIYPFVREPSMFHEDGKIDKPLKGHYSLNHGELNETVVIMGRQSLTNAQLFCFIARDILKLERLTNVLLVLCAIQGISLVYLLAF